MKGNTYGMQSYIAFLAAVGIAIHLILRFGPFQGYANYPLYITLILGGSPLVFDLFKKMVSFNFSSDLLAGISIVTSVILGQYLAGALVILMLSGGEAIEKYALRRASKVLEALARRAPTIAHRQKNGTIEDIPEKEIAIGDKLIIFPHATPCPLLLAIPVAIIGSISLSASRGILIKNPVVLEQITQCQTMIFDKTGTLTYGKPTLTEQIPYNQQSPREILKLVASLERYSKHPLAAAILDKAEEEKIQLVDAKEINEPKGEGLKGRVDGHEVMITNRKKWGGDARLLPEGSGLECLILIDGHLEALFRFRDTPRKDSKPFIQHLFSKHGFKEAMIVSGDREEEVRYLANAVGISHIYASQSPEEKVNIVLNEVQKRKTAFLGDGINDAPALVAATVGIALGTNSDITAEAAGAVIMDNTLERVDEFIHISGRMRKIAL